MSHFILHAKAKRKAVAGYLAAGLAFVLAAGGIGYALHCIGTASAKSRETVLIYTEEELEQYLLDQDSEEYNLNGRYQLEAYLDLGWLYESIGSGIEPFTGSFDGNGHVISGLQRPMFGVVQNAHMMRMFFSEAEITESFTYYDGEHYVDGYGALAAYAVDTEIINCGMGGEIQVSNPVETWYQTGKASPADADRSGGEIFSGEVLGPEGAGSETAEPVEKGPGVETEPDSSGIENSLEDSGEGQLESSQIENAQSQPESNESENSQTEDSQTEDSQTEDSQTGGSQTESGDSELEDSQSQPENSKNDDSQTESDQPQAESSKNNDGQLENGQTQPESSKSDAGQSESGQSQPESDGNEDEHLENNQTGTGGSGLMDVQSENHETIAIRKTERQYHMMKLSEVIAVATPAEAEETTEIQTELPDQNPEPATPSDAMEAERPYVTGGDREAVFTAVTADRVAAGGLIAQLAGNTIVTESFTCVTVIAQTENVEIRIGGFSGIAGAGTKLENSYSSGILDGTEILGGFVAVNDGVIVNCYSSTALTMNGNQRGGFAAEGNGRLSGCIYDQQMACPDQEDKTTWESAAASVKIATAATPADSSGIPLEARNTIQMSGMEENTPGIWYRTDHAYPQIKYFALHENKTIADYSKVSAVTLVLPDGVNLRSVTLEGEPITLLGEMDGQEIVWSAEGDIHIDENHQITMGSRSEEKLEEEVKTPETVPTPEQNPESIPNPDPAREPAGIRGPGLEETKEPEEIRGPGLEPVREQAEKPEETVGPGMETESEPAVSISMNQQNRLSSAYNPGETNETETSSTNITLQKAQLKAVSGVAAKTYSMDINTLAVDGGPYADWGKVGEAIYNGTLTGDKYIPTVNEADGYYEIETPEALAYFAYLVNHVEGKDAINGRILKELDLFGTEHTGITYTPDPDNMEQGLQWVPIGNGGMGCPAYKGNMQGNAHGIKNLVMITADSFQGFFGKLGSGAVIEDIGLKTGKLELSGYASGAVVGKVDDLETAGVRVLRCWNEVDITSNVAGGRRLGGIVSEFSGNSLLIDGCWNTGDITNTGLNDIGGILGKSMGGIKNLIIQNCYNEGNLRGSMYVGGILGTGEDGDEKVLNCYNTGIMTATKYRGGIAGFTRGTVNNCYYLSGKDGNYGAKVLTDTQLKSWAAAFALNGQSMNGAWSYTPGQYPSIGTLTRPDYWTVVGQGVIDGLVTGINFTPESGIYKIGSAEQLAAFAATVNNGSTAINANLTLDINLTGERYGGTISSPIPWYPIGNETNVYKGTFDGAGKAIGYMKVEKDGYAGLFGCAGGGAVITGVGMDSSCKVTSTGDATGNGTAALVGAVKSDGTAVTQITIQNCYSRAEVTGAGTAAFTAGFVGNYLGSAGGSETISNCYNTGKITTLYGTAGSAIAGSFLHGSGGGIKNCYWDSQTSGGVTAVVTGGGATVENCSGKTTAVMKSDGSSGILDLLNANLGTGTWYRVDKRNDGYPIFMKSESEVTWADVGAAVMAPRSKTSSAAPGTEADPYLIWTAEDLAWFAYQVNSSTGKSGLCAELMADINLFGGTYSGHAYDKSNPDIIDKAMLWDPIGNRQGSVLPYYTGTFHGNSHTISAMRAEGDIVQGLFGRLYNGAEVKSLTVTESLVTGTARYAGGIAGEMNWLSSLPSDGSMIIDCHFTGDVTTTGLYAGGITGCMTNGSIIGCGNRGNVSGVGDGLTRGGIVGIAMAENYHVLIDGCYNSSGGAVVNTGTGGYSGGIAGDAYADFGTMTVRNCYNLGTVMGGGTKSGGISGEMYGSVEIKSCYHAGPLTGGDSVSKSIVGYKVRGNITNCYYQTGCPADTNAKEVSQEVLQTWGMAFALNGGQLRQDTGISWNYNADKNDGYPYPAKQALRDAASWEDVGEAAFNGLLDGAVPGVSGSTYQIGTVEQLAWFAYQANNGNRTIQGDLTADLDMAVAESRYIAGSPASRLNWVPIGKSESNAFQGVFGQGNQRVYEIQNLYVSADGLAGLFGQILGNGTVMNTGVSGCDVTGTEAGDAAMAGGIAGRLRENALISHCYNRGGSIVAARGAGYSYAGGIAGLMNDKSVIEDCYHLDSKVESIGNSDSGAGGIVSGISAGLGENGVVRSCYNACGTSGSITSSGQVGGIIASAKSSGLPSCYSETLLGNDAVNGVVQLGTTDDKRQSDVDGLNTTADGERKGTDRVWFTSLASEETRGLPTLTAPEMYSVEIAPATANTGTTKDLSAGITIPDTMLRGIHLETDSTVADMVNLTAADTVSGNFHTYGTDNANVNLGLKTGTKDISGLAQSLTVPTADISAFSQLTLYTAAAYTHAAERVLLLDMSSGTSRYEIRITIPGVTSKPLKVSLPVAVNMELDPNVGTQPISYSADLELKNLNDYPIKAAITSVEQLSGKDVELTPIAKTTAIDPFKPLAIAGIKLGITLPLAGADTGNLAGQPDGKIYYTPAGSGSTEKWMTGDLGYDKTLRYRYFIEHSRVHGKADQSFGFKIIYKFEIPAGDNTGVVTAAPAA